MPDTGPLFFTLALFAAGGILMGAAGSRLGAPLLLIFLVAGMMAGSEGPGGIVFEESVITFFLGTAAIAVILFEGGLRTQPKIIRQGIKPGSALAFAGTVMTAFIVAPVAMWLFDMRFANALLLGAIVSSTDAAAVFALAASGVKLPEKVTATLEVESGFNDPIAIILVMGLVETLAGEPMTWWQWIVMPAYMLIAGGAAGYGVGWLSAWLFRHVRLPVGLKAILAMVMGLLSFGLADLIGGSGFIAIYIAGVVMAWKSPKAASDAAPGVDGLAWLAQTGLFFMLGLYVTPSHLAIVAIPAALTAMALFLLARPLASFVLLAPFKFTMQEKGFIAWTGLRGATPVFLGIMPLLGGAPNASLYLSAALAVVLVSLVVQGWTAPLVARQLRLTGETSAPPARGELFSRLGSMSIVLLAGMWFTLVHSDSEELPTLLVYPETTIELMGNIRPDDAPEGADVIVASFPPDFPGQPADVRQAAYPPVIAAAVQEVNEEIMADRMDLVAILEKEARGEALTLEEQSRVDILARSYRGRYRERADLPDKIDIIPPSLAVAQSILATGWGSSETLMQRNAVYGGRGGVSHDTILDATRAYATYLNTHPAFDGFRQERAGLRAADAPITGPALAGAIGPYVGGDSAGYIGDLQALMTARDLGVFDATGADPGLPLE
ncbi:potassium/proton antiporter [Aquisalinus flavus]|uniref:Cation/H+ exchanger transmembrane domain-containing protein n=1 Tax=Aquisalinus flavus TaxID=1526572 RepID=A0A8J2V2G6_9PROT|nr:potassium/proton antiporter [Aquisalinus flavus]MBD0426207.1 potassium/proton antiporter [Aquisalinus flavus]UNE48220.1 potassium/proton antiporter [Aquisalinus flavus]GGD09749.1 hypothetical protein GCM10011342_18310 [Aquisalinus flavus]